MWFKIHNKTINFDTITNFLCDDDSFVIFIEFIGGSSNRFSFETLDEYYDTKTYLNNLANNDEKTKKENRKQKIQQMFEPLRYIYPIGKKDVVKDMLSGYVLVPFKNGKLIPEDCLDLIDHD